MWKVILSVLDACFTPDHKFPPAEELRAVSNNELVIVDLQTTLTQIKFINNDACTLEDTNNEITARPVDYYRCGSGSKSYEAIVYRNQNGAGQNLLHVELKGQNTVTKVNGNPIASVAQNQTPVSTK